QAEQEVAKLEREHAKALRGQWQGANGTSGALRTNGVTHLDQAELELGRLHSQNEYLRGLDSTHPSRQMLIDHNNARISRINQIKADKDFKLAHPVHADRMMRAGLAESDAHSRMSRPIID